MQRSGKEKTRSNFRSKTQQFRLIFCRCNYYWDLHLERNNGWSGCITIPLIICARIFMRSGERCDFPPFMHTSETGISRYRSKWRPWNPTAMTSHRFSRNVTFGSACHRSDNASHRVVSQSAEKSMVNSQLTLCNVPIRLAWKPTHHFHQFMFVLLVRLSEDYDVHSTVRPEVIAPVNSYLVQGSSSIRCQNTFKSYVNTKSDINCRHTSYTSWTTATLKSICAHVLPACQSWLRS